MAGNRAGDARGVSDNIQLENYNPDSLFLNQDKTKMTLAVTQSISRANDLKSQIEYNKIMLNEPTRYVSRHQIEWHRKFAIICLSYFLLYRAHWALLHCKGGLGTPGSVIMFIVYYIIDNAAIKWPVKAFGQLLKVCG